jgi:hypothetical protein
LALGARRQHRSVDHDDRNAQLPRGLDLGIGICATGVLADDAVDAVLPEQRQFIGEPKRTARNDQLIAGCRQRQGAALLVDDAQHKLVLAGQARKRRQLLASYGQKHSLQRPTQDLAAAAISGTCCH